MNSFSSICIVDDDDIYQFVVTKILESLGSENIISFSDGEEALNFMLENLKNESELPDIILLDINMPIMDGFQFMEEYVKILPQISKSITIYIVSSSVDPVDIERAKEISAISDYIIKPTKPGELKSLIEKLHESGKLSL